ncbi:MAG: hypothetical protein GXP29_11310, partial [Planctomycetes bacterium]|nr:hypothetical protein [Planctomycetota bacterium]
MRALALASILFILLATNEATRAAGPALTVYNQDFAVVRQDVPMNLKAGINNVTFANITAHAEPDSVILRDPTGKTEL